MASTRQSATIGTLFILAALTQGSALAADSSATDDDNASIRAEVGANIDSGHYGERIATTVFSTDLDLSADLTSTTTASVGTSYLFQTAPVGFIGGRTRAVHRSGGGRKVTNAGIGDSRISLDQMILEQSDTLPLDWGLFGEVKLGTADVHKGLGSGETDYLASTYFSHDWDILSGRCELGYDWRGSPGTVDVTGVTQTVDYQNTWSVDLSATLDLGNKRSLELGYYQESAASISANDRASPPSRELSAEWATHPSRNSKFKASILKGFGRNSPGWGAGLAFVAGF